MHSCGRMYDYVFCVSVFMFSCFYNTYLVRECVRVFLFFCSCRSMRVFVVCFSCPDRSRIETLQVYRQNGITTLAEGIEFDKARQRRQEEVKTITTTATGKTLPSDVPSAAWMDSAFFVFTHYTSKKLHSFFR